MATDTRHQSMFSKQERGIESEGYGANGTGRQDVGREYGIEEEGQQRLGGGQGGRESSMFSKQERGFESQGQGADVSGRKGAGRGYGVEEGEQRFGVHHAHGGYESRFSGAGQSQSSFGDGPEAGEKPCISDKPYLKDVGTSSSHYTAESRGEKPYFKHLGRVSMDETKEKQRRIRTLYGGTSFMECNFMKPSLRPAKRRILWTAVMTAKRSANSKVIELQRILSEGDELTRMKAQRDLDEYENRVVAFRTAPTSIKFQEGYGERPGERFDYRTRMSMALPPFPDEPSLNDEDNNWVHAVFDVGVWSIKKRHEEMLRGIFRDPESIKEFIHRVAEVKSIQDKKPRKAAMKELVAMLCSMPGQSERNVRTGIDSPLGQNFSYLDEFLETVKTFSNLHGKVELLEGTTRRIEVRYRHVLSGGMLIPKYEWKTAWDGPNKWEEFGSGGFDHVLRYRTADTNVALGVHFAIG